MDVLVHELAVELRAQRVVDEMLLSDHDSASGMNQEWRILSLQDQPSYPALWRSF
jgi:hypothetical protein